MTPSDRKNILNVVSKYFLFALVHAHTHTFIHIDIHSYSHSNTHAQTHAYTQLLDHLVLKISTGWSSALQLA